jgi:hypothetical protein
LAVSLAAAISSHYYAVLLLLPLVIGEGVRSRSLRRLDLPIWLALGVAMTPLFLHLPLITNISNEAASFRAQPSFWARPSWGAIPRFYMQLLTLPILPLGAVLMLSALYSMLDPTTSRPQTRISYLPFPFHEMAAAFGFTAIPVAAVLLAKMVTGVFTDRYALPAVIGFSILLAAAAARLLVGRALIGIILVLSLCGFFVVRGIGAYKREVTTSLNQASTYKFLSEREHDLPIVVPDLQTFMPLAYYAPQELAARLVYLADPDLSLRHIGHSSVDQGILKLKPWFPVNIERYGPYVASHRRFLVYGNLGWFNWLFDELIAAEMRVELRGRHANQLLFLVSPNK